MSLPQNGGFEIIGRMALERYARERAQTLGLVDADVYFEGVFDNLLALQSHAVLLRAELERAHPAAPVTRPA